MVSLVANRMDCDVTATIDATATEARMYTYRRAYNNNNNVVVVVAVRGPTMAGKTKGTPINNVNAVQTSPSRAATVSTWATVRCNCVVLWTAKFRATILVVAMDKK